MLIEIAHRCDDFNTYRAARVKSLFNAEEGYRFDLRAELPVEEREWKIGLVVGPSGSGKSSIGRRFWGEGALYRAEGWPDIRPFIDAIAPDGDFDVVTGALSAVGLGSVPSWLRPYSVLSTGEQFRADLARILCEPERGDVVIDEFTSVVNRQIARIGAMAFAKAWKRQKERRVVLLSCHDDIVPWVQPDWTYSTESGEFTWGCLQPRPPIHLDIFQANWSYWPRFEPHHYLKAGAMPAALCYVGFVDGEPVCHLGMGSAKKGRGAEARACRLVVMPEWQGAGVGMRFLNYCCELQRQGAGRLRGRRVTTIFHTSHPGLVAALRRDPKWVQVSARLHGVNKRRSTQTMRASRAFNAGYGGHFRAVQGFRYVGAA